MNQLTTTYKSMIKNIFLASSIALASVSMTGCGYNTLQTQDESVTAAWSDVVNQYQRRADLFDNLVEVTKKYASQEKEVFTEVANARSAAGSIQMTPEMLNDPAAMQKFQDAQAQMGSALSRLLAVSENYPELKSDRLFENLQQEIAGTENRIAVARKRYIEAVQAYNGTVRKFPTNLTAMVFGMDKKENFSVENETQISQAPKIDFEK